MAAACGAGLFAALDTGTGQGHRSARTAATATKTSYAFLREETAPEDTQERDNQSRPGGNDRHGEESGNAEPGVGKSAQQWPHDETDVGH